MSRRGRLLLVGLVAALAAVGLGGGLLSVRRIEGAVPGEAPLLGLATAGRGFLVGTGHGVLSSDDGVRWRPTPLPRERALVASGGGSGFVLAGGSLYRAEGADSFDRLATAGGTALAVTGAGEVRIAAAGRLLSVGPEGEVSATALGSGAPREIIALAAEGTSPTVYAGGVVSGLWRSEDGGTTWRRLLQTPARAVLIDPENPARLLLATPGGILLSDDRGLSWGFTELRARTEGVTVGEEGFFALTSDRLVVGSRDGERGWEALASRAPGR